MGDVMGEVNKRRGRVLGMTPAEDSGMQIVEGEVPMAEMDNFATYLRQVTQGRGSYEFAFARYEDAPANVAQKIIEKLRLTLNKQNNFIFYQIPLHFFAMGFVSLD